ncbi:MAG: hypothetical protein Q8Q18_02145 [bacterium]|nr:hypothetical protein [bacterium]
MQHITDLLARFKRFTLPDETVRKTAVRILNETYRVPVSMSDVSVRNNVMYINTNAPAKMMIYTQKKAILALFREALGDKAPTDIR